MSILLCIVKWTCISLLVLPLTLMLITLALALITSLRQFLKKSTETIRSAMLVGRVSHTRLQPVVHSFAYPLFFFALDLEEAKRIMKDDLWPLSSVMSYRAEVDHLKNGEGGGVESGTIEERICRLVESRLKRKQSANKKSDGNEQVHQFSLASHRVILLTHLSYYGYCFNPVSFYYLVNKSTAKTDAIVAEVSNTPWIEMQCYVLHPDSVDITKVQPTRPKKNWNCASVEGTNYVFAKSFHVSPFMDMEHTYDWIFWNSPLREEPSKGKIAVKTDMRKKDKVWFTAQFEIEKKHEPNPLMLAWQLIRFPVYCFIIQIWIHYEAFWLFVKGVAYVPHPDGSETAASLVIGKLMEPFFALKDWFDERKQSAQTKE